MLRSLLLGCFHRCFGACGSCVGGYDGYGHGLVRDGDEGGGGVETRSESEKADECLPRVLQTPLVLLLRGRAASSELGI